MYVYACICVFIPPMLPLRLIPLHIHTLPVAMSVAPVTSVSARVAPPVERFTYLITFCFMKYRNRNFFVNPRFSFVVEITKYEIIIIKKKKHKRQQKSALEKINEKAKKQ